VPLRPETQNARVWSRGNFVRTYKGRELRPPEGMLLLEHRELFAGRVLELGVGAGRVSGYLVDLAEEFHGIDLSPRMIEHCRRRYPRGTFEVRDIRDLGVFGSGSFDLVFAGFNVLDVLDDAERLRVLGEINRILSPKGSLAMSTHNRAAIGRIPPPGRIEVVGDPLRLVYRAGAAAFSVYNHRRLAPFERQEKSYAIVNDPAHEYRLLHYYIDRDEQERQLEREGFELVDCLDEDGHPVAAGEGDSSSSELHYLARRARGDRAAATDHQSIG
jgi:SAM-dependent methyltransferase